VTGRPHHCGWFDVPLMRYAAMINRFDSLVVTKLDVLDEMEKIPVCVGYRSGGQELAGMPATVKEMNALEPVYECLPGWRSSTFGISSYHELPVRARDYLDFMENKSGVEVGCISTGPERNQTMVKPSSHFARLFT
jgi:adenylosuccinate synthase